MKLNHSVFGDFNNNNNKVKQVDALPQLFLKSHLFIYFFGLMLFCFFFNGNENSFRDDG